MEIVGGVAHTNIKLLTDGLTNERSRLLHNTTLQAYIYKEK